jgi:hypothetical protein
MKDLSGFSIANQDKGWFSQSGGLPPTLLAILEEVGRFYSPFLLANAQAIEEGSDTIDTMLDSGKVHWTQPSFKYQAKCLKWLQEEYGELDGADKKFVDGALGGTGCMAMFQQGAMAVVKCRL